MRRRMPKEWVEMRFQIAFIACQRGMPNLSIALGMVHVAFGVFLECRLSDWFFTLYKLACLNQPLPVTLKEFRIRISCYPYFFPANRDFLLDSLCHIGFSFRYARGFCCEVVKVLRPIDGVKVHRGFTVKVLSSSNGLCFFYRIGYNSLEGFRVQYNMVVNSLFGGAHLKLLSE